MNTIKLADLINGDRTARPIELKSCLQTTSHWYRDGKWDTDKKHKYVLIAEDYFNDSEGIGTDIIAEYIDDARLATIYSGYWNDGVI